MNYTFFVVDVESDGPVPGLFSMLEIGAVAIRDARTLETYQGVLQPVTSNFDPEALEVNTLDRGQCLRSGLAPEYLMPTFSEWVRTISKGTTPVFVSDNPGFDFAFVSYYLHRYVGRNIFGHTSRSVADLYRGAVGDPRAEYSKYRAPMCHSALADARTNATALLRLFERWSPPSHIPHTVS